MATETSLCMMRAPSARFPVDPRDVAQGEISTPSRLRYGGVPVAKAARGGE
jgi:hypothetical protein